MDAPCPGPRHSRTSTSSAGTPAGDGEFVDLGLYLAGALPEAVMRSAEGHIFSCPSCRERLGRLRDLKGLLEDRAVWSGVRRPRASADAARECLSAAETLLAVEGRPPARAVQHLARCVACRADLAAVDDTTHELAEGKVERPTPRVVASLKGLSGYGDLAATHADQAVDLLEDNELSRPIIVPAPTAPAHHTQADAPLIHVDDVADADARADDESAEKPAKNASSRRAGSARRLSPRPSRRVTAAGGASDLGSRRGRSRARPVGVFAFATAAAAAAVVIVVAQSGSEAPPAPHPTEVARGPEPAATSPAPARPAPARPVPGATEAPRASSPSRAPAPPREPDAPSERETTPPAPTPTEAPAAGEPAREAPEPAPSAASGGAPGHAPAPAAPTVPVPAASPEVARSEPRTPSRLDTPPTDDGATVAIELAQLSGGVSVRERGADKWAPITRRAGRLELKPGDRIRTTSGAFVSLESGAYEVCLAPKSELVLRGAKSGPVLGLAEGRVLCSVESFPEGKSLVVATHAGEFSAGGAGRGGQGVAFSVAGDERRAACSVEAGSVACRGAKGPERVLGAGVACAIPRGGAPADAVAAASEDAWARGLRPQRQVVYETGFDRGDLAGFTGATSDERALQAGGRSLVFEPLDGNEFWGLSARAPKGRVRSLRAAPDLKVQITVWLEKESHLLLQLTNERQGKYYKKDFGTVAGGQWVTLGVPLMDLETYFDPAQSPVREGDVFNEIEIVTGNPRDRWKALLAGVVVYRKLYR